MNNIKRKHVEVWKLETERWRITLLPSRFEKNSYRVESKTGNFNRCFPSLGVPRSRLELANKELLNSLLECVAYSARASFSREVDWWLSKYSLWDCFIQTTPTIYALEENYKELSPEFQAWIKKVSAFLYEDF